MSASLTLPPENQVMMAEEWPIDSKMEPAPQDAPKPARFDDELWPWVQLPDGRLELVADAA